MQTPSEAQKTEKAGERGNWASGQGRSRRSVFGNYTAAHGCSPDEAQSVPADPGVPANDVSETSPDGDVVERVPAARGGLQAAIDTAVARAFVYQFLARAYEDPASESWAWLTGSATHQALRSAVLALHDSLETGMETCQAMLAAFRSEGVESFQAAYVVAFGHAARGDCPLNEIEYGDLKADPLFQPHRLADLAGFYRAFGLEVADDAAERPDHLGMELEFMAVLAAKEAFALEHQLDEGQASLCREAQRKFLREHLGRWCPAFARRLARVATDPALAALAQFTGQFIAADCAWFGVAAGNEDLLLRPVDQAAESLCASCGLSDAPPREPAAIP